MPYLVRLPSGARITVFIYDGPISRALAFEGLLDSGEAFADRLMGAFRDDRDPSANCEHCHRRRNLRPSSAPRRNGAFLCNPQAGGEAIRCASPTTESIWKRILRAFELEVFDNSSWSCVHGVERWRNDCGCNSGMNPSWRQEWRAPLRAALDYLRDQLSIVFEQEGRDLFRNPWKARDSYIEVILDRSPENRARFLAAQGFRRPSRRQGNPRISTAGDAAPRHVDVHQLRLVLRRTFRDRNRADHRLRGAGAPACRPDSRGDLWKKNS